jgi:valyl-tRNA synthetase
MLGQERRLGASFDWGRLRYTMDEVSARAVRAAFQRLYERDLAYRTEALVNWCPGCRTSVSDLEVVSTPETGTLWSVSYHLIDEATGQPDPTATITVATTRPETILGDTAVAVHPDDDRYRALVGRRVRIPFVERDVPVIADSVVDRAFGTGAVKITPAHDHDDYETGRRHGLPMPTILDDAAAIAGTGTPYDGLDRYEARRRIVVDLAARGDLAGERSHEMVIGRCQRSDDVIEPRLKTQWFIRTGPLAAAALEATRSGRTRIVPGHFEKTWEHWLTNIRDWNVSRQLWWGHRIPAWYCPDGHVTVSSDEAGPDACAVCGRPASDLTQDPDIFDTWFSSGLWPFSTLGWPEDTADLRAYYPTTVLVTGYDILFFWVVRMMLFGLYAMRGNGPADSVPFRTIMLHGLVRDSSGKKMSKSKGNVVDPLLWIDAYGADAVRLALLQGANPGADQAINEEWVVGTRNFCTKLWNATRFALMSGATVEGPLPAGLDWPDEWILSRLAEVVTEVDRLYERYEFAKIVDVLYHFTWDEVCDWYIELAKLGLTTERADRTRRVLGEVLDALLRLLHPMIPFVTEALWTALTAGESLVIAAWPSASPRAADAADARAMAAKIMNAVTEGRRFRTDQGLKPAQRVPARVVGSIDESALRSLLRLDSPGDSFTPTATLSLSDTLRVEFDLSGAIDVAAERARLRKDRAGAEKERTTNAAKLGNEAFLGKAPDAVVASVRERLTAAEADLARIDAALAELPEG